MPYSYTSAHLVGESSPLLWGQTYHEGATFIVIEMAINEGVTADGEAPKLGKILLEKIIAYLEEKKPNNLADLNALTNLLPSSNNYFYTIIVGLFIGDLLYVLILGKGCVALAREKKWGILLQGSGTISGRVLPKDTIFFLSPTFQAHISQHDLEGVSNLALEEIKDTLAALLHKETVLGAAGIVIKIGSLVQEESSKHIAKFKQIIAHWQTWSRPRRMIFLAISLLCVLFIINILHNYRVKETNVTQQAIVSEIDSIKYKLDDGKALVDVNILRSRTVLAQAKEQAVALNAKLKRDSPEAKKVNLLLSEIETLLAQAAQVYKLSEVPLFYDLTLIKNQAQADKMALAGNTLAILDTKHNSVYTLTVDRKRPEIIAGGETLVDPKHLATTGEATFVIGKKRRVVISHRTKEASTAVARDDAWGTIVQMAAFAGNIYLIDSTHNAIWKYQALESGFSDRIPYLPDDASHAFSPATSLAIDGAVWTITGNRIVRFMQGKPDGSWSLTSALDQPLSQDTAIYTDESVANLYILDRGNKRIVVVDKEGRYISQYVWEKLKDAATMVVSAEQKKILLLIGNKIYGMAIK